MAASSSVSTSRFTASDNELLAIIDVGQEIMQHFLRKIDGQECPLIKSKIVLIYDPITGKKGPLGKGEYGTVYRFDVDGNTEDYVVKEINDTMIKLEDTPLYGKHVLAKGIRTLGELAMSLYPISLRKNVFIAINGGNENELIDIQKEYYTLQPIYRVSYSKRYAG